MTGPGPSEDGVRALCAEGEHGRAATDAVNLFGAEILSYLVSSLRDEPEGHEAFSLFLVALWEGLPRFRWECSFRTWAYVLARRAITRTVRERGRARVLVPLTQEMEEIASRVRSSTPSYLKTANRKRVAALRAELDPEDRQLLVLRVNRRLGWEDVARVLLADEEDGPSPSELSRKAAALRKRFERLKLTLRERVGR
jgi:RNA polymerase sigma-70 factor (ECF subfamily)